MTQYDSTQLKNKKYTRHSNQYTVSNQHVRMLTHVVKLNVAVNTLQKCHILICISLSFSPTFTHLKVGTYPDDIKPVQKIHLLLLSKLQMILFSELFAA